MGNYPFPLNFTNFCLFCSPRPGGVVLRHPSITVLCIWTRNRHRKISYLFRPTMVFSSRHFPLYNFVNRPAEWPTRFATPANFKFMQRICHIIIFIIEFKVWERNWRQIKFLVRKVYKFRLRNIICAAYVFKKHS